MERLLGYRLANMQGVGARARQEDSFTTANAFDVVKLKEEGLLFVQHPGFYNKWKFKYTYERNKKSRAYMPLLAGKYYVCGGVNGGRSENFLQMCEELNRRIDEDEKNGIIAIWHDESHINRYCYEQKNSKILNPSYCYPEDWNIPFKPVLMVRDKSKWIDVERIKSNGDQ